MYYHFTADSGAKHRIKLGMADELLTMNPGYVAFEGLYQMLRFHSNSGWEACIWNAQLSAFHSRLELDRDMLPFRYGSDGDFGGGQTEWVDGVQWVLRVGAGECSLTRVTGGEVHVNGIPVQASRIVAFKDLRGEKKLITDRGEVKLSRRKQQYRWYDEIDGLSKYFTNLEMNDRVRCYYVDATYSIGEMLKMIDEYPGADDGIAEMLREQGEKGRKKLEKAIANPKYAKRRHIAEMLLKYAFDSESS